MTVETDADRAVMLDDFGVALTKSGDSITVIFDKQYVEVGDVSGYKPVALARTSDVSALSIVIGDTVTINSVDYTVQVPRDDGTGFTELILELV